MSGVALKNLSMFSGVCGQDAMPNVILVTTMWDEVKQEAGERREKELKETFWKDMLDEGCNTRRFNHTTESARDIIKLLFDKEQETLQLPKDIVDTQLLLRETKAGITLHKELQKLIRDQKDATRRLQRQVERQSNKQVEQELRKTKSEIEEKIRQTADELRELKIPFRKQVLLYFSGRSRR
jgi:hypothetical protein